MSRHLLYNLGALLSLLPAALVQFRGAPRRDQSHWLLLGVAAAGTTAWAATLVGGAWHTGFSIALWVSIAASLIVFIIVSLVADQAWRLTPLLFPYLFLLGIVATIWAQASGRPLAGDAPAGWLGLHIVVAVLTYALMTIGVVAGFAVVLQERALKRKRPTALTHLLPSVANGERLQMGLLAAGEIVLAAGLASGIATEYLETGRLLILDHKTILSLIAFVFVGALLISHHRAGVRGRHAARYALIAYLLITLAYPGVKFVTDVLM